jgi:hypothetical protein
MIGPTYLLHPSPVPHFKTLRVLFVKNVLIFSGFINITDTTVYLKLSVQQRPRLNEMAQDDILNFRVTCR